MYEVKLGVDFLGKKDLRNIESRINKITDTTHRAKIDLDTSRIHKQFDHIEKRFKSLTGTKGSIKGAVPIDTGGLEQSLNKVASIVGDIKTSIGSLDGGNMKSLLSSINQIATSLGRASEESETLVSALNALSKKDFGVNIGLKLGGNSVSNAGAYGAKVRQEILPELKRQEQEIGRALAKHYKTDELTALNKLAGEELGGMGGIIRMLDKLEQPFNKKGDNLELRMREYQDFFNTIKKSAASLKNEDPDLSSALSSTMSGFSKSADELVKDAHDIKNGAKEAEDSFEKLKQVFSGGNLNVDSLSSQLDPIVKDLSEIKMAIQSLSSGVSLDGLAQSFNRLSEILEQLTTNAKLAQSVLGGKLAGSDGISNVAQGLKDDVAILERFRLSLENIGMGKDEINAVANRIKSLGVQIEALEQKKEFIKGTGKRGKDKEFLSVDISGVDKFGNAIQLTERYDIKTGELIKSLDGVSSAQQKAGASANTFTKQQKTAVSNLTNQINQLHRAAVDQNASRPIKDEGNLKSLEAQYRSVEVAIKEMGDASSETFVDQQNKVRKLISEYKSMVSELRNAENVSTKMKGTDFKSGLDIAKNDLAKFKADAKDFPQITKTIKDLDEAIANVGDSSSLNSFNDQLRVARSELAKVKSETAAASRSEKVGINVSGLKSQISELQKINPEINKFEAEINGAKVTVNGLLNELSKVKTQGDFSVVNAKFKAFVNSANEAGYSVNKVTENVKLLERISEKLEFSDEGISGFDAEISKIETKCRQLSKTSDILENDIQALKDALRGIDDAGSTDDLIASYKEYEKILKRIENQLEINKNAERLSSNAENLDLRKQAASLDIDNYLDNNTRAARVFGDELRRLQKEINACDDSTAFRNLEQQVKNIKKEAAGLTKGTQTFGDRFKKQWEQYKSYLSVASVFMYVEQGLRDMFQQVVAIDTAMTELKKVTDETSATYDKFLTNAGQRASEIGTTIDGLVTSTADFARLGYDFADAANLAEVANIYTVVGDEIDSVDTATQSVISTMKAFKVEASDSMSIVDKFNEVSNNFAISSGGIGEALTRSASSLAAANNSLDESVALITAAM